MPKKETKQTKIESDLYNLKGELIGKIPLPVEIFSTEIKPELLAQAVRVYQANQRLGTHSTKTRSEVSGSTRKIYRQKGTGRARHGDVKAPIFIGGGIAFGAKPRDYSLEIPKKMKKMALYASLTDKFQAGRIKVISGLKDIEPRTKIIAEILDSFHLDEGKKNKKAKILLITPNNINNIILSGRNLENLDIREAVLLNTYEVLSHSDILFMEEAIPVLKGHFIKKEEIKPETVSKEIKKEKTTESEVTRKTTVKKQTTRKKTAKKVLNK